MDDVIRSHIIAYSRNVSKEQRCANEYDDRRIDDLLICIFYLFLSTEIHCGQCQRWVPRVCGQLKTRSRLSCVR